MKVCTVWLRHAGIHLLEYLANSLNLATNIEMKFAGSSKQEKRLFKEQASCVFSYISDVPCSFSFSTESELLQLKVSCRFNWLKTKVWKTVYTNWHVSFLFWDIYIVIDTFQPHWMTYININFLKLKSSVNCMCFILVWRKNHFCYVSAKYKKKELPIETVVVVLHILCFLVGNVMQVQMLLVEEKMARSLN